MIQIETNSPNETAAFAKILGERLRPGDVLALNGDLGAGKTVFSKGIAEALHIPEPITSPTFIIMQVYKTGTIPLYHFDVYRIEDPDELYEIGAEEYFGGDGICLIEWAELIKDLLPKETVWVRIRKENEIGFDHRIIRVEGLSDNEENCLAELWRTYENSGD